MKYAALLRGINVGGNSRVAMSELRKVFEDLGFESVKTLLNSGNVIFETSSPGDLEKIIEEKLEKKFGFKIVVITRSSDQIQKLIDYDPFKAVKDNPKFRLYVTFIKNQPEEVCSVVNLESKDTTDLMKELEKKHGKNITTRNWNTVLKIQNILNK